MTSSPSRRRPWWVVLLVPFALACVWMKYRADSAGAHERFVANSKLRARQVGREVERSFTQIYQSIRTIARLPGVRSVVRYADALDGDAA